MTGLPVLLGDSIFRRLLERQNDLFSPLSKEFCIGGSKVSTLFGLAIESRHKLKGLKVFVLIGCNDILKNTPYEDFCKDFKRFIKLLRNLKCDIILCEVLPLPLFGRLASDCQTVIDFNKYIRSFEPSGIKVIHVYDEFVDDNGFIKETLYCKFLLLSPDLLLL